MDELSREKTEIFLRIQNALFYLKMKSSYFPGWDRSEESRLEGILGELTSEYAVLSRQAIGEDQRAISGT